MPVIGHSHLWRAQAKLIRRGATDARVVIPAMEAGHDEHLVPLDVVPVDIEVGERFHLRCTLDHEHFAVAPHNGD